jgi:D-glycero-D-manno-heptose 1,7-bisphosphate phosphatase
MKRAVFLDRDGVLNLAVIKDGRPYPPSDAAALVICAGAESALNALRRMGYTLICITNQPDVARGLRSMAEVEAANRKVCGQLPLDDLFMCPHDDSDNCECRKPKPGMLYKAERKWDLDLRGSWMIGDRAGDIAAGRAAGCRTIFLDFGYAEAKPEPSADYSCRNLSEAVSIIKENENEVVNNEDIE